MVASTQLIQCLLLIILVAPVYGDQTATGLQNKEILSPERLQELAQNADEAIKADAGLISSNSKNSALLEKEVTGQLARIKIIKLFQEPDTILYQIVVEDSDMSTPLRVGFLPKILSLTYSVDDNVYICFDRIKIEYWTSDTRTGKGSYSAIYVSNDELRKWLCRQKVKESYLEHSIEYLIDPIPIAKQIVKSAKLLADIMPLFTGCKPYYDWWAFSKFEDGNLRYEEHSIFSQLDFDASTLIDGNSEEERNERRSDAIMYYRDIITLEDYESKDVKSVRITIPLKVKDTNKISNARFWIDSSGEVPATKPDEHESTRRIGLYFEDKNIKHIEIQVSNFLFPDPNLEAAIRAAINKPNGSIDIADLEGLKRLVASFNGIKDITGLEYCINLKVLYLGDNQITDLSPLSRLTNLKVLGLEDNQITDLSPLSGLRNLEELHLLTTKPPGNNITDLSPLAGLTNLKALHLQGNPITDISPLSGLTNLKDLYLSSPLSLLRQNPKALLYLRTNQTTKLYLRTIQITDISPLSGLKSLEHLDISYNQVTDLSPLSGLKNLKELELWVNQITDSSPLSGLTNLEWLYIGGNQITDVSPLSGLTNLEWLYIGGNQITDVSPLSGLKNLKALQLGGNQITDISPLSGLKSLEYLSISNNQVTDVSPLSGLTNLERLDLYDTPITDLSPLSGLRNLEELWLNGNQIAYASQLSGLTNLKIVEPKL